ncbi:MAG: hypothetical protein IPG76_00375 [Acidobacteria bacterium]|nr:hypothetical protein [Acidobacteriota bacterium]
MDAGDRWMLMDAAGTPMLAWDFNKRQDENNNYEEEERLFITEYDDLHRPRRQWLSVNNKWQEIVERFEYQDAKPNDTNNLNGQLIRHYDPSGRVETIRRDFKGNVEEVRRRLNNQPQAAHIEWLGNDPAANLDGETFIQITEYDALNRMTRLYNWHREAPNNRVAVYVPSYNAGGCCKAKPLTWEQPRRLAATRHLRKGRHRPSSRFATTKKARRPTWRWAMEL